MRSFIDNKKVLAAFNDPAGAKAVLAYLYLYGDCAKSITVVSDREYGFFEEFGLKVNLASTKSYEEWLAGIQILITGTTVPAKLELQLIKVANKEGIPSLAFVDHWTNFMARFLIDDERILPSKIGLIDKRALDLAVDDGLPMQSLEIFGNPYHEYLRGWKPVQTREMLCKSLGLIEEKPIFLYAPEPISRFGLQPQFGIDEVEGYAIIRDALRVLPGDSYTFIIKGHPNQNHDLFKHALGRDFDSTSIYTDDSDLLTLSYYSEAIFGFFSNALVEAALIGCNVIRPLNLLRPNFTDSLSAVAGELFNTAFTMEELKGYIKIRYDNYISLRGQ